jgi:hypothetical protein
MNQKAQLEFKHCKYRGTLALIKHYFHSFFKQNNGISKVHMYKPLLSDIQIQDRLKLSRTYRQKVRNDKKIHYCLLKDEKWFYTTFCHSKNKIIPNKTMFKTEEEAQYNVPEIHSCHFATRVNDNFFVCYISEHLKLKHLSKNLTFMMYY